MKIRRSGKTTRLIDLAVQMLFEIGTITVLTNHEIFNTNKQWKIGLLPGQIDSRLILIDPDAERNNKAQIYFYEVLKKRLCTEHYGEFTVVGYTFKLK